MRLNQLDIMHFVAVDLHLVSQVAHLAVDPHLEESFLGHLLEKFAIMSFAAFHQRGEHHNVLAGILAADNIDNLVLAVLHHRLARVERVGFTNAGIE